MIKEIKNRKYALVTLFSKGVRTHVKNQKIVYDPDLALAFCDSAEVLGSKMNAIAFYVSMHKLALVFDVSDDITGIIKQKPDVFSASIYSGDFFRRVPDMPISWFNVKIFNDLDKFEISEKIKIITKSSAKDSLILALRKHDIYPVHGINRSKQMSLLMDSGVDYEKLPEIYRRGIVLTFNEKGKKEHYIISRNPYTCFLEKLTKYEDEKSLACSPVI